MKERFYLIPFVLILTFAMPVFLAGGIDINDTKLLSQPAISKTHIAFAYAGDLWAADLAGKHVRRLTSAQGLESNPVFSSDGKLIAFNGEYDGNIDVYVVPVEGGIPKRLTWHPGSDVVRGFTPDGLAVLFISSRYSFTRRYNQLFTVSVEGDVPSALEIPNAYKASYSPKGKRMAYTPLREVFRQWKHYRGGTVSTIWLYTFSDHSVEKIPQPEGRCNDTDPMWVGDKIYFRSDRNGEFNFFSFDLKSKEIKQFTFHNDFPVLGASAGGGKIIYEQAGHLHIYDLANAQSKRLIIGVAADLLELRPRYIKGFRYIRSGWISPSGARAVLNFRGDIITVPAEKGDPRNLTQTPAVHERWPVWSPDGKFIAYFSDESGEYELHIKSQDGKGKVKKNKLSGAGFYDAIAWSPDGQKISYADNSLSLRWIDLKTGVSKKIASQYLYGPRRFRSVPAVWSPDSKWIAYTLNTAAYISRVYLYSIEKDKSYPVSDGMSDVSDPVFDESGKYLYFFGSTDAGPIRQWFAMSNADMEMTRSVYLAVLRKDVPSPLAKESDEEKGIEEEKEKKEEKPIKKAGKKKGKPEAKKAKPVFSVDLKELNYRILALPIRAGAYFGLQAGEEGEIYYLEAPTGSRSPYARGTKLKKFT
ncbi:MAG: hypothetical protein V3W19_03205, partial [Desulfatiglandales bacterium]